MQMVAFVVVNVTFNSCSQSKIKRMLQRMFGALLLLSDDGFINIHGEELGVALMYSKIHSISTLSKERSDKVRD